MPVRRYARRTYKMVLSKASRLAPLLGLPDPTRRAKFSSFALDRFAKALSEPGTPISRSDIDVPMGPQFVRALAEQRYVRPRFVEHTDYRPPPSDVVFAAVCNDKYAPGLEALILSLLKVYPELACRFVVYHDGSLSKLNQHRLTDLYPHFDFQQRTTDRYGVKMGNHWNHVRIGHLGYLTLEALGIDDASYVVILDSDLLVLGDISPLWTSDKICAVPDAGYRPFAVVAESTGRPVLNSGVLSFPASELGVQAVSRADEVLARVDNNADPDLERFADQKFWNIYLSSRPVELLPQGFNTNKALLNDYYPNEIGNTKILHVTGPKPWYSFINETLLQGDDRERFKAEAVKSRQVFALWNQLYWAEASRARLKAFHRDCGADHDRLAGTSNKPFLLMGNGPSLAKTDLSVFSNFEKVVFNWFVNHDRFDEIRPDHLVLPSHMFFGGWHTPSPVVPEPFLEALHKRQRKPRLWTSYYFKPFIDESKVFDGYEVSYFFFEKPFKRRIAHCGIPELDVRRPLVDSNTGVLTAGVAISLHLGATELVLTGCDSNYGSAGGSYFYDAKKHASATTREESLVNTWVAGGEGAYGYERMVAALQERGIRFRDATLEGRLTCVPKVSHEELRALNAQIVDGFDDVAVQNASA